MAQIRGTAGYQLGGQNPFGGPRNEAADPSPLDQIREQTSKIEDLLDSLSGPIKPYVPSQVAPFRVLSQSSVTVRKRKRKNAQRN